MRTGSQLAAAIGDGALADRLATARRRLAERLDGDEDVRAARAVVERRSGDDAASVADRIAPLLADPRWRRTLIARLVGAVREEPLLDLPLVATAGAAQSALVLLSGEAATVALVRMRLPRQAAGGVPVQVGGSLTLLHPLRAARVRGTVWRAAALTPAFTIAAEPPLVGSEPVALDAGRTIRIDGRREALGALHGVGELVMLRAVVHAGRAPFARVFDPASGRLLSASATDEAGSRMAVVASLLGAIGRPQDAGAVATLLGEEDFSLRWLGLRIVAGLDARAGAAALARLGDDPHPEVRAAARAA